MIEELHTASELLLAELVPLPRGRDFYPDRLKAANAGGIPSLDDGVLLRRLSTYRNSARHHAHPGFFTWLESNWESVSIILEHLRRRIEETGGGDGALTAYRWASPATLRRPRGASRGIRGQQGVSIVDAIGSSAQLAG